MVELDSDSVACRSSGCILYSQATLAFESPTVHSLHCTHVRYIITYLLS